MSACQGDSKVLHFTKDKVSHDVASRICLLQALCMSSFHLTCTFQMWASQNSFVFVMMFHPCTATNGSTQVTVQLGLSLAFFVSGRKKEGVSTLLHLHQEVDDICTQSSTQAMWNSWLEAVGSYSCGPLELPMNLPSPPYLDSCQRLAMIPSLTSTKTTITRGCEPEAT